MNRRSFLAGLLACTARCSFGLALPVAKVKDVVCGTPVEAFEELVLGPYQITIPEIDMENMKLFFKGDL